MVHTYYDMIVRASELLTPRLARLHAEDARRAELLAFTCGWNEASVTSVLADLHDCDVPAEMEEILARPGGTRAVRHAIVGTWLDVSGKTPAWLSAVLE